MVSLIRRIREWFSKQVWCPVCGKIAPTRMCNEDGVCILCIISRGYIDKE